jgi:predicted AlkP superfamily pyrophosphatase or phosphodiesterase
MVAVVTAALTMCASTATRSSPAETAPLTAQPAKPTLLFFITVDQLRPDYLDRFKSQLNGGLARLVREGAVFTDAHHDHAITETAPGHATLMSGRFPRSTGITRNIAGVNDREWPLIDARDVGAAPFRFRGTTLTDWLIAADPATRAFSVSAKDRAAILPIGRSKQEVYWFASPGVFTTSIWYRDTLPTWVAAFNAQGVPQRFADRTWDLLLEPSAYPEADSVPVEDFGRNFTFPHRFAADSARAASQMRFSPMMDKLTLRFALEGVRRLDLGKGPAIDVLAISLSATDYVGHFYGPESRELHDQIVRLDRVLGAFMDSLFALRDPSKVVVAFSADHGVSPIPELHNGIRVHPDLVLHRAREIVIKAGGDSSAVDFESGALFLDSTKFGKKRLTTDAVVKAFLDGARRVSGVQRVDRFADLRRQDLTKDEIARRWLNMFPDDLAPVAVVTLAPGNMFDYPVIATHGSPHQADSHVPIIFFGPWFKPGRYDQFVRTVDIAPTLAKVLGVIPPAAETLDGRPLSAALR